MKIFYSLLLVTALLTLPAKAQDVFFEYSSLEEGLDAAKEQDKLVLLYFYDEETDNADAYNHIWSDPLIVRFVDKLAVPVVVSAGSEAGQALLGRKRRGRRNAGVDEPGIYFFSETGRSLGVLRGALEGQEGIGRVMLMLGAADYARHEDGRDVSRRYVRYRW